MKFKPDYISLCKKLPPRKPEDWEVGDFLKSSIRLGINNIQVTMMVVHTFLERLECVDETGRRKLHTVYKTDSELVHLPSSPIFWMSLPDFKEPPLLTRLNNKHTREVLWNCVATDEIETIDSDPLLVVARTWQKVVDEMEEE